MKINDWPKSNFITPELHKFCGCQQTNVLCYSLTAFLCSLFIFICLLFWGKRTRDWPFFTHQQSNKSLCLKFLYGFSAFCLLFIYCNTIIISSPHIVCAFMLVFYAFLICALSEISKAKSEHFCLKVLWWMLEQDINHIPSFKSFKNHVYHYHFSKMWVLHNVPQPP